MGDLRAVQCRQSILTTAVYLECGNLQCVESRIGLAEAARLDLAEMFQVSTKVCPLDSVIGCVIECLVSCKPG